MVTEILISPTKSGTLSITLGSADVYGTETLFTAGDVGKQIIIRTSAGDFHTSIAVFGSATHVKVLYAPTITETGCYYSMDFYSLDLYDDFPYSYNFSIADIREPDKRNSSYSKTIRLPGTKGNNEVLAHIYEINLDGTFNVNLRSECLVIADTIQIFKGNLQLTKVITNNGKIEYEVTVFGKTGNLFNDLGEKLLTDLDLSEFNHITTKTVQEKSWATEIYQNGSFVPFALGLGYVYPVINNGLDIFQHTTPNFTVKNISPAIYVKTIIDKIFSQLGYSYSSNFFDSALFSRLIIPAGKQLQRTAVAKFKFRANSTSVYQIELHKISSETGADSIYWNSFTLTGDHLIDESIELPDNVDGDQYYLKIFNGLDITTLVCYDFPTNTILPFFSITYAQLPGAVDCSFRAEISTVPYTILGSAYAVIIFDDDSTGSNYDENDAYDNTTGIATVLIRNIATYLTDNIKQRDFLLSLIKMFNLYVEPDKYTYNTLNIEPRDDFYSAGETIDWTKKLDLSKDIEIIPMGDLNFKQYLLTYKQDGDYLNSDYFNRYKEIYGQHLEYIQTDFQSAKNSIELIFSPTPSGGSTLNPLVVPTILKENTTTLPNNVNGNIRILYYGGLLTGSWSHFDSSGSTSRSSYPYAGHVDDPQTPSVDILFDAPRLRYWIMTDPSIYTDQNLFNVYYQKFLDEITDKDSKIVTAYFHLTPLDIYNLDFRNHFFIDNTYYRLNKIFEYNPLSTETTKVELIKIKEAIVSPRPIIISTDSDISVSTNLGGALGTDEIFVGNDMGVATGIAVAGDVSMTSGRTKVNAIRGNDVEDVVPDDGDVLVWVDANSRFEPQPQSSGGGENLNATLVIGNTTGGEDIEVSAGDKIIVDDATASKPLATGASKEIITSTDAIEGSFINSLTGKTTPVDTDFAGLMDSADSNKLKKLSWANIKATLKAYFDTLYSTVNASKGSVTVQFNGSGGVIRTGCYSGVLTIPFSGTITGWDIFSVDSSTGAALSGSIVVDGWKDTYANFPPTVADTIFSSNKPTLSSASKNQNTSMNVAVTAGDTIQWNVDSVTTCVLVTVILKITKS